MQKKEKHKNRFKYRLILQRYNSEDLGNLVVIIINKRDNRMKTWKLKSQLMENLNDDTDQIWFEKRFRNMDVESIQIFIIY